MSPSGDRTPMRPFCSAMKLARASGVASSASNRGYTGISISATRRALAAISLVVVGFRGLVDGALIGLGQVADQLSQGTVGGLLECLLLDDLDPDRILLLALIGEEGAGEP